MAGLGRKEWSPGDTLNAADVNGYLMDQSVMVFAGTAARASAIPTPSAGMVAYSTATSLQVYNGTDWVDLSTGYGVASGGASTAITVGGTAYTLLSFTSDATLTVSKSGLFDVMLIGGGAGGGGHFGGGGGAGGLFITTVYLTAAALSVTVGAGGAAGSFTGSEGTAGANGTSSRITVSGQTLLASPGGGGGGGRTGAPSFSSVMRTGASGGGGSNGVPAQTTPATGQAPFGFSGGNGIDSAGNSAGGGGGGNQAVGGNASSATGGTGGTGYDISTFISGAAALRAVGGAGMPATGTVANGAANTGNGGTGGISSVSGGSGGSGIVYVRFRA